MRTDSDAQIAINVLQYKTTFDELRDAINDEGKSSNLIKQVRTLARVLDIDLAISLGENLTTLELITRHALSAQHV